MTAVSRHVAGACGAVGPGAGPSLVRRIVIMKIQCPSCQAPLSVPDTAAGRQAACPHCGATLTIPGAAPAAPPSANSPLDDLSQAMSSPQAGPAFGAPTSTPGYAPGVPQRPEGGAGKTCGILSIIFGAVAFLFCPPLFGIAGIILGAVSISKSKDKKLGTIGLIVSILGLIIGMIIGVAVMSAMQSGRH
jgi:hypothetical protein